MIYLFRDLKTRALKRYKKLIPEQIDFIQKSIGSKIKINGVEFTDYDFSELNYYLLKEDYYKNLQDFEILDFVNAILKNKGFGWLRRFIFFSTISGAGVIAIFFWAFNCYDLFLKVERVKLKARKLKDDIKLDYSELDAIGAESVILSISEKYADYYTVKNKMSYNTVFTILYHENVIRNKIIERNEKQKEQRK